MSAGIGWDACRSMIPLVLLYLDGHDHASIAGVLGISVSNVGTKLLRIKNKLRAAFDQRAANHTETLHANR